MLSEISGSQETVWYSPCRTSGSKVIEYTRKIDVLRARLVDTLLDEYDVVILNDMRITFYNLKRL